MSHGGSNQGEQSEHTSAMAKGATLHTEGGENGLEKKTSWHKGRKKKRLEATNSTLVGAAIGKNSILNNSMNMLSRCFSSSRQKYLCQMMCACCWVCRVS